MSYQSGYVVCVVVNGQVVDEHNKTVHLSEGQEYGLRLRNKTDKAAIAQILIDGENVSEGGYIIRAYQSVDILRHSHVDKAFKLVSHLRKQAQEEGKDELRSSSGVIEVRWFKEKEPRQYIKGILRGYDQPKKWKSPFEYHTMSLCDNYEKEEMTSALMTNCCSTPGVTVEGSQTGQSFNVGYLDVETNYVSVFLYLRLLDNISVQGKPQDLFGNSTIKPIGYCANCGHKCGKSANYCAVCGRPIGCE